MNAITNIGDSFRVALDDRVRAAIASGCPVAYSISGGKDSVSIAFAADRKLDQLGHPKARRYAIHSDLGDIEWQSTPATVEAAARAIGVSLVIVRPTRPMIDRWLRRFELGCARYSELETYHLTAPWSSAKNRFCTAEEKTQVILPELLRRAPTECTLSVVGIRREESVKRALTPVSKVEGKRWKRATGASVVTWHPGVDVKQHQVFSFIDQHRLPLHEAYELGCTRMGCSFCVLASANDIGVAARAPGNLGAMIRLVSIEGATGFSFQPDRWLGDVAPDLLPTALLTKLTEGKRRADDRRRLEASLPANLRYVKGWPQRIPSIEEAGTIATVRGSILAMYGLSTPYGDGPRVRDRIAELYHRQRALEAA
jgi:3'-phosphoadenosine 5'-phosphosulfate sulfotransferase (PAPS reductase)/FAD synthetase